MSTCRIVQKAASAPATAASTEQARATGISPVTSSVRERRAIAPPARKGRGTAAAAASNARGSADASGQRGTGTASRAQQSNYSYEQLNRDAAARNGGYQNHQRRTSSSRNTGMSRGGGMRPRRR